MNRRAQLLDINDQAAETNAADRAEAWHWRTLDRTDYVRVGGRLIEADRVPHPSDVADLSDEWGQP